MLYSAKYFGRRKTKCQAYFFLSLTRDLIRNLHCQTRQERLFETQWASKCLKLTTKVGFRSISSLPSVSASRPVLSGADEITYYQIFLRLSRSRCPSPLLRSFVVKNLPCVGSFQPVGDLNFNPFWANKTICLQAGKSFAIHHVDCLLMKVVSIRPVVNVIPSGADHWLTNMEIISFSVFQILLEGENGGKMIFNDVNSGLKFWKRCTV